ncbi:MAG: UDP-N-acetylmuramoyl-L-alanine--D-glutamate ligase [Parvibaculales bacterium]
MIELPHMQGETAVFGLGRSGLACVRALVAAGQTPIAWDDDADKREAARAAGADLRNLETDFGRPTRLLVSPGIALTHPQPHKIIRLAQKAGAQIIGDMDLFAMARAAMPDNVRVIAITGTNGKSTSTALVAHMLTEAGWQVHMGGNIGIPVLDLPMPDSAPDDKIAYVLELSSYQLDLNRHFAADIGVLTNLTPDHLDRHGDMEGYAAAKARLFANMAKASPAIIGCDSAASRAIADDFATQGHAVIRLVAAEQGDDTNIAYAAGAIFENGQLSVDLTNADALRGLHNAQNAAAAFAVGRALKLDAASMQAAFASFAGLAHRLQPVAQYRHLTFVNDSKATNPEAAMHALTAYANIYWIAGGRSKADRLAMPETCLANIRHAYLIGEAAASFAETLSDHVPVSASGTLAKAVSDAASQAMADRIDPATILLSPACASFDQFADFEARGEAFCAAVQDWCATARDKAGVA